MLLRPFSDLIPSSQPEVGNRRIFINTAFNISLTLSLAPQGKIYSGPVPERGGQGLGSHVHLEACSKQFFARSDCGFGVGLESGLVSIRCCTLWFRTLRTATTFPAVLQSMHKEVKHLYRAFPQSAERAARQTHSIQNSFLSCVAHGVC